MKSLSQLAAPTDSMPHDTVIFQSQSDLKGEPSHIKKGEQFIGFHLGVEEFYLPIRSIREVALVPNVAYVPNANPYIDGITSVRGTLIPIVNIKKIMGFSIRHRNLKERLLVLEEGGLDFALIVDSVSNVVTLSAAEIEKPHPSHANSLSVVSRLYKKGEQSQGILDPVRILTQVQGKKTSN